MKQDNTKLFDFIYETVNNDCGDGDLALVLTAQDHRIVADQFQQYLLEHSKWGVWERTNQHDGDVTFSCQHESFTFSNKDHFCRWSDLRDNPENCLDKVPCTSKVVVP